MAKIADFRFDETTWRSGTPERRMEWKILLEELIEHGDFLAPLEGTYFLLTPTSASFLFEALDEEGLVKLSNRMDASLLADPIREYDGIIKRLDGSGHHYDTAWFQAVDLAKKVVHDRASGVLHRAIGDVAEDEATLRRIFSILFSLRVDTTKRPHAHRHG